MKPKIVYIGNKMQGRSDRTLTTLDTLSQQLQEEGYQVITASSKASKPLRLFDMLWTVWKHASKISWVLIDTYSTQNFWYAVLVGWLCRLKGIRYIPILHGGNLPHRLEHSPKRSQRLFGKAYKNVAPSPYLMEAFTTKGFTNVVLIPNALEMNEYTFIERSEVAPKLLWVRSFAEIYNPFLAIRVLEQLLTKFPEATLCMVGPDKDGSLVQCKDYVEKRKLPVTFTGKLSKEAWRELSGDYDIFINTTHFDNTPVSVLEAMALGLPVVSTNVGGIPYLLKNDEEALLVAPDEVIPFVHAVERLLKSPELVEKLSSQGRRKVENFDWSVVKQAWFALLDE